MPSAVTEQDHLPCRLFGVLFASAFAEQSSCNALLHGASPRKYLNAAQQFVRGMKQGVIQSAGMLTPVALVNPAGGGEEAEESAGREP